MIEFVGYAPDVDPTAQGVFTDCVDIVPTQAGFKGSPEAQDLGVAALPAATYGAAIGVKLDNSSRLFAGTETGIYEAIASSWTLRTVTTCNASIDSRWAFGQFGDSTLAINKGDPLFATTSGNFTAQGSPKASCLTTVNGFVMLADTNETTYGNSPDRWWCSGLNDLTNWVPAVATQSTTGRLVDTPGPIRALKALGNDVVAYKDRAMYLGRYVGPPVVWQFFLIPGEIGCSSQDAVVNIGSSHVFMGYENFYMFDGTRPVPIGDTFKRKFFNDLLDPVYRSRVLAVHDKAKSLVYFYYPKSGSGGVVNGCVVFNYLVGKWGVADRTIEAAAEYLSGSITYDTLSSYAPTYNTWPSVSYDSPFWNASSQVPAIFKTDHKIYSLTGASLTSSITTGDVGDDSIYATFRRLRLRYLQSPTSAQMINFYRDVLGDALTQDATIAQASGKFDVLRSARWHRAAISFVGDHEFTGVVVDAEADGEE